MIYSSAFFPRHSSQAINSCLGHHKLCLRNPPGWGLSSTSVSLSLLTPRQLELFQARANTGSMKDFRLVATGFSRVASPLTVKQEDVNRLCHLGVLGGYRLRHSVILNGAALALRASVRITGRDCFPGKALCHPSQQNCVSEPLFVHLHNMFLYVFLPLSILGGFIMSCRCTAALENREALCKAGGAKETVLYSSILRAISPSLGWVSFTVLPWPCETWPVITNRGVLIGFLASRTWTVLQKRIMHKDSHEAS